jgi:5-methyltetrahydropteroyltriglutamate--homocysteine methyltransferase
MLRSTDRIVTSHAGALEQPEVLRPAIKARDEGQPYDEPAFYDELRRAVAEVVRAQVEAGLDSVNDGEFGKQNFTSYVGTRISGYEPLASDLPTDSPLGGSIGREYEDFREYYARRRGNLYGRGTSLARTRLTATGPLRYTGQAQLQREIENFQKALEGLHYREAFLPAAGPGALSGSTRNAHYGTEQDFLFAIADAMHEEYQAIVDAGFLLQVDDPSLLSSWQNLTEMSVGDYQEYTELRIEAINRALRGIPPERVRLHTCWASYLGPHTGDIPLRDIVDVLLKVNTSGLSIEASNPRHEPDWQVWEDIKLPDGMALMPGVVGHFTDFIERPELVADRLVRYANVVGRENVIAGTDCGLRRVGHPEIAFAKFRAMAEGARLASQQLWGRA